MESSDLYVDFVALTEPLPEATLRTAAASPDVMMRWRLTEYPFVLPNDVYLQLVNDPEESVRHVAIRHWPATTEQIDAAVRARPELRDTAVHHPHALLDLMDDRPVGASDGPEQHAARCRATAIAVRPFGEWCLTGGGAAF